MLFLFSLQANNAMQLHNDLKKRFTIMSLNNQKKRDEMGNLHIHFLCHFITRDEHREMKWEPPSQNIDKGPIAIDNDQPNTTITEVHEDSDSENSNRARNSRYFSLY